MISNDLANLAYRIDGYVTLDIAPTPAECSRIAAELRKLSRIIAQMEGLPLDREALQVMQPTSESEWEFRRSWQMWLGKQT